jgi:hypothetical protein
MYTDFYASHQNLGVITTGALTGSITITTATIGISG